MQSRCKRFTNYLPLGEATLAGFVLESASKLIIQSNSQGVVHKFNCKTLLAVLLHVIGPQNHEAGVRFRSAGLERTRIDQ
jgi:hypothetical protein